MSTSTIIDGEEKRLEPRTHTTVFIRVKALDHDNEVVEGQLEDVGSNGAAFFAASPLPIGSCVSIEFGGKFAALGEIVDENWDVNRNLIRMGIRFIRKSPWWPF